GTCQNCQNWLGRLPPHRLDGEFAVPGDVAVAGGRVELHQKTTVARLRGCSASRLNPKQVAHVLTRLEEAPSMRPVQQCSSLETLASSPIARCSCCYNYPS